MRRLSFLWRAAPTRLFAALALIPITWLVAMIGAGALVTAGPVAVEVEGELVCGERLIVEPAAGAAFAGAARSAPRARARARRRRVEPTAVSASGRARHGSAGRRA